MGLLSIPVFFHSVFVQVQLVQQVINGVSLLVDMEKKLERRQSINTLIPK